MYKEPIISPFLESYNFKTPGKQLFSELTLKLLLYRIQSVH
jgi:hypothetical protein